MIRCTLFTLLGIGVIVRSLPAQDYLHSRYDSQRYDAGNDRSNSLFARQYDSLNSNRESRASNRYESTRYRSSQYASPRVQQRTPQRSVHFYDESDRAIYRTYNDENSQKWDLNRAQREYPENRYLDARNRYNRTTSYSVRQASHVAASPNQTYRRHGAYTNNGNFVPYRSDSPHREVRRNSPTWPPIPSARYGGGYHRCPPSTPPGTYVGDGIAGQPVLYTHGQPVRNMFRSLGL